MKAEGKKNNIDLLLGEKPIRNFCDAANSEIYAASCHLQKKKKMTLFFFVVKQQ